MHFLPTFIVITHWNFVKIDLNKLTSAAHPFRLTKRQANPIAVTSLKFNVFNMVVYTELTVLTVLRLQSNFTKV